MSIESTLQSIRSTLPQGTQLVAVSKFHPVEKILEAYQAGQHLFGESRVQELLEKVPQLPQDIQWHFIGHLQTNKVKLLLPHIALIHSIDSLSLLEMLNSNASKRGKKVKGLLQIHIAQEQTKFGFSIEECKSIFEKRSLASYPFVEIVGLMGMATNTDDNEEIEYEFSSLQNLFLYLKKEYPEQTEGFKELSMGMSDDYPLALKHGATLIRVGSKIFGERRIGMD